MTGDPTPPDPDHTDAPPPTGHVGPSRGVVITLGVLIVVFVFGLAAIVGYWVLGRSDSGGALPTTAPIESAAPSASTAPSTSTVTVTPSGEPATTTRGPASSTSSTTGSTPVTTAPGAPEGSRACPIVYGQTGLYEASSVGTSATTCGFAEQVRLAYSASGPPGQLPRTVRATSPETGQRIAMMCAAQGPIVTCNGGDDALVYLY
ncbi:hypothetical protein [Williamsia phyllosphaerae]|uniref:Serine/threonine protein kinase n=1 Tax=Williamsia phyllosphaerae TaxID=885042 RepID=A0ABQ1V084_9NOCA|nr:hypothetical protein [Williamsia phyllosphaerae]GGF32944.1 hypothetical protein GCM10007298_31030 [Williamsia phyllosphaerae]